MRLGYHLSITAFLMLIFSASSLSAYLALSKVDLRDKLVAEGLMSTADNYVDQYASVLIPPRKPPVPTHYAGLESFPKSTNHSQKQNLKVEAAFQLVTLNPFDGHKI